MFSKTKQGGGGQTTPADLDRWIRQFSTQAEGAEPSWGLVFQGSAVYCQCQADVDRMRLVAPVCRVEQLENKRDAFYQAMLVANYHSALDPRYAVDDDDVVVAAYLHPLASLDEAQFVHALKQVVEMVKTFGTTFSSMGIVFGGQG